ncbi:hypothetical protein Tco_1484451 [Tanacetum coccineum]
MGEAGPITAIDVFPFLVAACIWLWLHQCDIEDIEKNERNRNEQDKDSDSEYGNEADVDDVKTDHHYSWSNALATGLYATGEGSSVLDIEEGDSRGHLGQRIYEVIREGGSCDISETGLNPIREESAVYNDEARTDE